MSDDHPNALRYRRTADAFRAGDIDVSTRVVSVFRYEAGQMVERWLYADHQAAWDRIFED